jgi:hypothetical protein
VTGLRRLKREGGSRGVLSDGSSIEDIHAVAEELRLGGEKERGRGRGTDEEGDRMRTIQICVRTEIDSVLSRDSADKSAPFTCATETCCVCWLLFIATCFPHFMDVDAVLSKTCAIIVRLFFKSSSTIVGDFFSKRQ